MKVKRNPQNETAKKEYLDWLHHAKGRSIKTVDGARRAIMRYEEFTSRASFKTFNSEKAVDFKKHLFEQGLGLQAILHTLNPLRDFLLELSKQAGFKRSILPRDVEYLKLLNTERRKLQTARKIKVHPTIEQAQRALQFNPQNDVEMRNRAIFAALAATGIRHEALLSLKVKHVDLHYQAIIQDPFEVNTKNGKLINSKLLSVCADAPEIVIAWVKYLREDLFFGDNDPLFPREMLIHDEFKQFKASGKLTKEHITTQQPVRLILAKMFADGGFDYFKPHSFRDMLTHHFMKNSTIEQFAAYSLNLGHENPQITVAGYYTPTPAQQFEILSNIGKNEPKLNMDVQTALQVLNNLANDKG